MTARLSQGPLDPVLADEETPPTADVFAQRRAALRAELEELDEAEIRSILYPRWVYHQTDPARIVPTVEARAALGPGWENRPVEPEAAAPVLTGLVPDTVPLGAPSFTIRVLGTGFAPDAVILWNGSPEPTTVVSATEVPTGVNMATASLAVTVPVAVQNGDGPVSNELPFTFTGAAP